MIGIYLRVSTEKQDEGMQINAIKRCIGEDSYKKASVYTDIGITGTTTDRPDYKRLLNDITEGKIHQIVTYEYSRLWRDLEEQSRMIKVLNVLDEKLISATEGALETIDDKLKANIMGSINVYEVERLTRRIREGIAKKKKDIEDGNDTWNGRGQDKKMRKRPIKRCK